MQDEFEIDVLIPAFNVEDTLAQSLESICHQTAPRYRILIVDDGSTDGTADIIRSFQKQHDNIVAYHKQNGGVASALNHGLERSKAAYIARFDADDICYPERLEVQKAYMDAHPDCVAVGCDVDHIDEHGREVLGLPRPGDPGLADAWWAPAKEPYIIHPFLFVRRAAVERVGGYRALRTSQDSDLYWRLQDLGRLHNLPDRLGQYRLHGNSVSGGSIRKGRVMAIFSQLAALSARRRKQGRPDLEFPIAEDVFGRGADTLDALMHGVCAYLDEIEIAAFRAAVGAKLLELSSYRDFEPDLDDCRFIAVALTEFQDLSGENLRQLDWHRSQTAARLLLDGQLRSALELAGLAGLPKASMRSGAHLAGIRRLR